MGDDQCENLFAAQRIGRGDDGDLLHRRVLLQNALDLDGADVLAGAADDVLLAVDEMERTVSAAPHHVAGVEPAAGPGFRRRLRVLEIGAEEAEARLRAGMAR